MTDISTREGAFVLFCSIVLGMALGLLYCVLSAFRINASTRFFACFWDFLCCPMSAVVSYIFFVAALSGEVRFFAVAGICLGFFVFYYYVGRKIQKVLVSLLRSLKRVTGILFTPVTAVFKHFIKNDFTQKYFKKLLKKAEFVLYNKKAVSNDFGGKNIGKKENALEEGQDFFQ